MFFGIRVNSALAQLGIRPAILDPTYRRSLQQIGRASGNSPQEVALWIASQLPLMHRFDLNVALIKIWIRKRKINPDAPEMRDALGALALFDLM